MTRTFGSRRAQRGATLIIGLIMMVLITLIVLSAFTLSSTNAKSVGNMQVREEAIAAANQAIEQVVSADFTAAPAAESINVDINKDDTIDYTVALATPVCVRAIAATTSVGCDTEHPELCTGSTWHSEWDIDATVTDAASGAAVRIRQGVRVLLTDSRKTSVCP
ncbi:MAG: PilX N-terminal domain-containing pilus assembly protein [Pseudomonadota bacterium]